MAFIDPVCKMPVEPPSAKMAMVDGAPVYFCSDSCLSRFLADPAAYPIRRTAGRAPDSAAVVAAVATAIGASLSLLALYFGLLSALSGWEFTRDEFGRYWPYIVALATGFGLQVAVYVLLRRLVHARHAGKVVAASGGASGAAMISCCSHYLVNLLPALGATGLVMLVSEYQVELFWVGIAANLAGLAYVGSRLAGFLRKE
ncbi:MAG: YHS domain-containing protein [Gemmatimonas sp.]